MTIEILGRACSVPSAGNPEQLFELLRNGICAVTAIPDSRWDKARFWHPVRGTPGKAYTFAAGVLDNVYDFDPAVFGISAREASYMDPQQRILLQLIWRALEDAGIAQTDLQKERVGVYVGSSGLDNGNLYLEDPASGGPYFMTGNTLSIVANRVSHVFGLSGPSMTIDTACSSSLVALAQAERALLDGEIDTAIVGGINLLLHPFSFIGFSQARMLSPEGLCRAYGQNGEGYVRAEGGGVIVLRRSDRVAAEGGRSRATLVATGMNSAGRTNGISLPSREAQADLLRSLYEGRGIDPARLAFVEGHGTGTRVGDPAEVWAIGETLAKAREAALPIGSIKTNIGHAEPASGILGLIKAMLALEHDFLPASLHAGVLNEEIDFAGLNVEVATEGRSLARGGEPRLAGVNSFGFGGTNVHVVISDPPACEIPPVADEGGVFMVSAHTRTALDALLKDYAERMTAATPQEGARIVSATRGRTPLKHRFAVAGGSAAEIAAAVEAHLAGIGFSRGETGESPGKAVKTAFVYAGNGSQWAGMALDAYRENAAFRARFDEFSALFAEHTGKDMVELLHSLDLAASLRDARVAQPLLFAIQAALTDCLAARGVKPDAVFGHSVGEVAAAYAAGALSAADAATVVAVRSRHQHALAGAGTMAAAVMSEKAAVAFAASHGLPGIHIAAVNAHNSVTISGPVEEIKAFRKHAQAARIVVHVLDIDYPFHHPVIDREREAFLAEIPAIAPVSGHTPFISTVTGGVLDGAALDASYWWRNVREPVAFEAGISAALDLGCNLFMEIAPRPILSGYVAETAKQASAAVAVVPTFSRPGLAEGDDPVERSAVRAVAHGATPGGSGASRLYGVELPPLPFENREYRPHKTSDGINVFGRDLEEAPYTLLGWRVDPQGSVWKNHLDALLLPDLAGHVVDGKPIMPGSAYIEIAVQAARRYYGSPEVEIANLEILRPLDLRDNRIAELSTRISPETGVIEIASREYLSEDGWTVHATARSRKSAGLSRKPELNVVPFGKAHEIRAEEAYETARRFGLDYAECFRLLSRAELFGDRHLVVDLDPPARPAHPWLAYDLDPVSIDAAFHGLVALFGRLTGDADGAPYIPVRFGAIRSGVAGKEIVRAVVEIQRFSPNSLKARFELMAEDGTLVAVLDDCRFRRTWLRQHNTLETVSFHYETVAHGHVAGRPGAGALPANLVPALAPEAPGEATLLLDAAVHRACHDIALALADGDGRIDMSGLPGDRAFACFLASCFYTLEDAGLAAFDGEGWSVPAESGLPELAVLLREVYRRYPGRVAEAVLVNDVHVEALERLARAGGADGSEEEGRARFLGEATLDHVRHHTPLGRLRDERVLRAAARALETVAPGSGFTVLEAGAVSVAFSARLADMAAMKGARLVILEPSDHLRRTLEIAFERNPAVEVAAFDSASLKDGADLAVSASGALYAGLRSGGPLNEALRAVAAAGGALVAVEQPSSGLADFIYGLTDDWFAESASPEFPLGRFASPSQWEDALRDLGFADPHVELGENAEGGLLTVSAGTSAPAIEPAVEPAAFGQVLHIVEGDAAPLALAGAQAVPAAYAPDGGAAVFAEAFAAWREEPVQAVLVLPATGPETENASGSEALQNHVLVLSAFAEAARARAQAASAVKPVRLVIVAPGGSPAGAPDADPVASGVWTFTRVLENEYEEVETFLLDADPASAETPKAVARLLAYTGAEREWLIDRRTGLLSVVRAVPGPAPAAQRVTQDFKAATIRQQASGRVDSIVWAARDLPAPKPGEVVVEVAATGLNFRDVMWSMGLLPEEALEDGFAGATIGMEMAGTVTAVGAGVDDIAPGDRVMGIGPQAFSTHMTVAREGLMRLPAGMDLAAAATVPVAFLTAWYAVAELGRIRAGETILIHGAAGGVGLAALQIAKLKGATVIATAGTVEKRRFLAMLGADYVFNSRTLDFVGDVLRVTGGEGVDLVLNSLFSEAMERSFELVKPFGRFLELGKRDYYSDRKLALRPFRRNVSYFGIDADQLLVKAPALTHRLFEEIGALFSEGRLTPLPYRAFNYDETAGAFRLMQNAGHIGKIVVRPPVPGRDPVRIAASGRLRLPAGVYLVVGGVGGFGLAAANWLASRGASHVALATRRGVADEETLAAMAAWKASGVSSSVHSCDVASEASVAGLLGRLRAVGPLKGVVHAAMVLDDATIANLDRARNRPVIEVKASGATALDRLTRGDDLALFLLFSSATTMIGNPGQGNYVAANGYLEGLARARRAAGLPALAVGFGAIADTGFLARNTGVNDILSKRLGKSALRARDALAFVERILAGDRGAPDAAAVMVAELDWGAASALRIAAQPLFSAVPRNAGAGQQGGEGEHVDLAALVAGKSQQEAQAILHRFLAGEIAAILKVAEDSVTADKVLKDIGLDSLMAMELGVGFQQKTGVDIPLSGMGDGATVGDIVRKLHEKVTARGGDDVSSPEDGFVEGLASKHMDAEAEKELGQNG